MTNSHRLASAVALLIVGAIACAPSEKARQAAESATATAQGKAITAAGEVFGARREAQAMFDSAHARFLAKDNAAAAANLRDAAAFTRQQAAKVAGAANQALTQSADELEHLASSVASGRVGDVTTIDHAIGRAQLAEAMFHCTNALAAWKTKDAPTTGAEMLMLTDHFERGASDVGQPLAGAARAALTNVRTLAVSLTKGSTVVPADVDAALSAMDTAIHTTLKSAERIVKD